MSACVIHVYGHGMFGAVVVDLEEDRVIAESPTFRFMDRWTRNQVNSYITGKQWRVKSELIGGSWVPDGHVHKPMLGGGCWAVLEMPARRSGLVPPYQKQCGQKSRAGNLTCWLHREEEGAARSLRKRTRK